MLDRHAHDVLIGLDNPVADSDRGLQREFGAGYCRHDVGQVAAAGDGLHRLGVRLVSSFDNGADCPAQRIAEPGRRRPALLLPSALHARIGTGGAGRSDGKDRNRHFSRSIVRVSIERVTSITFRFAL